MTFPFAHPARSPLCLFFVLFVCFVVCSSRAVCEDVAAEEAWKRHWAFQPVKHPPLPPVRQRDWPRTSVDRFILAKLEERGLTPSAAADRRTLLRRVTFDLIGLPPTPQEIAAFEKDRSPDAFATVVDRLLASPHYGERWGRYWLDVARYADHNHYGFSMWLAGSGVKGGIVHGATDEFGFAAVDNKVHVHDLHATILHLLGIDHEKLTYRYAGRDFRLTDVHGRVVEEILA